MWDNIHMTIMHTPQDKAVDHGYYSGLIKRQKKPVYTSTPLPPYELPEDHWLKPHLGKEVFINQNTPIEEVL
jgi:hypothetical protein